MMTKYSMSKLYTNKAYWRGALSTRKTVDTSKLTESQLDFHNYWTEVIITLIQEKLDATTMEYFGNFHADSMKEYIAKLE